MYKSNNQYFGEIRQYFDNIPIIETHEHYTKYHDAENALDFITNNYYWADFASAGSEGLPHELPGKERYELFLKFYKKSKYTAYAKGMIEGLRICWGVDNIDTYEQFQTLEEKLKTRNASIYDEMMEKLNIKAKVSTTFQLSKHMNIIRNIMTQATLWIL